MKNINKNLIFGLGIALVILVILAIGIITLPRQTHAYVYDSGYQNRTNLVYTQAPVIPLYQPINPAPVYQNQPVVYQTQPKVEYVNQNTYSSAPQANTTTTDVSSTNKNISTGITTTDYKSLTASSIFGRFSFMPSGLMQWILLAIFILVIVILIRKVSGQEEEYHSTPLKHA